MVEAEGTEPLIIPSGVPVTPSQDVHKRYYNDFCRWCIQNTLCDEPSDIEIPPTACFILYFNAMQNEFSPSTLWARYFAINSHCKRQFNVNLSSYVPSVFNLLRKYSRGSDKPLSNISSFTKEEVATFLNNTPDRYLDFKVILIFGLYGAITPTSMIGIDYHMVTEIPEYGYSVEYCPSKFSSNTSTFLVPYLTDGGINPGGIIQQYFAKIHANHRNGRFLKNWNSSSKLFVQKKGKESLRKAPQVIAEQLKLEESISFKEITFENTARTFFVTPDGSPDDELRYGRWKNQKFAQYYMDELCAISQIPTILEEPEYEPPAKKHKPNPIRTPNPPSPISTSDIHRQSISISNSQLHQLPDSIKDKFSNCTFNNCTITVTFPSLGDNN